MHAHLYSEIMSASISCMYVGQAVLVYVLDDFDVFFCNIVFIRLHQIISLGTVH